MNLKNYCKQEGKEILHFQKKIETSFEITFQLIENGVRKSFLYLLFTAIADVIET